VPSLEHQQYRTELRRINADLGRLGGLVKQALANGADRQTVHKLLHELDARHAMKASALDRGLSLKKLEAYFGPYTPSQGLEQVQEQRHYESTPLHRSPERGKLFEEYRQGIEERKVRLEDIKRQEAAALFSIRERWTAKRRELERMNIDKRNRRRLIQVARKHEAEELTKARSQMQDRRGAVRRDVPFTSWNAFLQHKTENGSEVALAVLRSLKDSAEVERETSTTPQKDWAQHGQDQFRDRPVSKAEQAAAERAILENTDLTSKGKTRLIAVLRMEQLAEEKSPLIVGFRHSVDHKGTVTFILPEGGKIMDRGQELFFSTRDNAAEAVALMYAQKKWGKSLQREGNRICQEAAREINRGMER
jgi:hypothetical protein